MTEELSFLTAGKEHSDRVLCFSRLLLQREKMVTKTKDVRMLVERRLRSWINEEFDALMSEAIRCGKQRCHQHKKDVGSDEEHTIKIFSRLIIQGKLRAAVRWITERDKGGVLHPEEFSSKEPSKTVLDVLREKHPEPECPHPDSLLKVDSFPHQEEVVITSAHVESAVRRMHGAAGPSGTDSAHWHSILLRFGAHSDRLRDQVAALTRKICNQTLPWESLRSLMSNRLIALDKCPGVRPIGVGETIRRLMGKCVAEATKIDLENVCGTDQLACGVKAGIEGAVHAMSSVFDDKAPEGWGMLLMDASNAFNSINRVSALWNARVLWPRASRFLFNSYRGYSPLIVAGTTETLYSKEGTTQGDPMAMLMYGVALMPLVRDLKSLQDYIQSWYADDAAVLGEMLKVKSWLDRLVTDGPKFGYFPEPSKSYLIVHKDFIDQAQLLFGDTGVHIVEGRRFLGGFIGSKDSSSEYLQQKIIDWSDSVEKLGTAAVSQPQAAFAALSKSLQCEWNYLQRVHEMESDAFTQIETQIKEQFLPKLFGNSAINEVQRDLFSLPAKQGGLGIRKPNSQSRSAYYTSVRATGHIQSSLKGECDYNWNKNDSEIKTARREHTKKQAVVDDQCLASVLPLLPDNTKRAVQRAVDYSTSHWLTVLPLASDHFDLSAVEYRDALCVRYALPFLSVPSKCDGCGDCFTIQHALSCKKGGLITQRHNEIRDSIGDLCSLLWKNVRREPIIREADDENHLTGLVADLSARGVWHPQGTASFDIRVIDTDAVSYLGRKPSAVLASAETEKKTKYTAACTERNVSFTPLVTSVDGALGDEFNAFMKRLAHGLSSKWERPYARVMGWVRCRMSFAILRATNLCVRGTRTKWRSLGIEDGASLSMAL